MHEVMTNTVTDFLTVRSQTQDYEEDEPFFRAMHANHHIHM